MVIARLKTTDNPAMAEIFQGTLGKLDLNMMMSISFERVGYMSISDIRLSTLTSSRIESINYEYKEESVFLTVATKNSIYVFEALYDQEIPEFEGYSEKQIKRIKRQNEIAEVKLEES